MAKRLLAGQIADLRARIDALSKVVDAGAAPTSGAIDRLRLAVEELSANQPAPNTDVLTGDWPRRLAWLPIPILLAAMAVLWAVNLPGSYGSNWLIMVLNFTFTTLASGLVVLLVSRSFLTRGAPGLLMLGCGVIAWGAAGIMAKMVYPRDANLDVTIHNSCVWLSAAFHFAGALLLLRPRQAFHARGLWLGAAYSGVVCVLGLLVVAALYGYMPTFFVHGAGGTIVRQSVLGSAMAMFLLTAGLLKRLDRGPLSAFLHWYILALCLIAIGLFGILIESVFASLLSWVGLAAQYLSGVYMLVAAIATVRESGSWHVSIEAALRQSEERFRALADAIPNLAWWANADGYITWYNRRWYDYTGTTPQDMEGWGWQSVHDPKMLPAVLERWKGSIASGEPFEMTFPLRGADGRFRPFLTRIHPMKDVDGRVVQWFGTNTDVEKFQAAELALRQSEERYRSLFGELLEGFCIIEMLFDADNRPIDFRYLETNPAFEGQTGWPDAKGKRVRELAPDLEAHWFDIYGKVALTGEPARFVNEVRPLNRWYDVSAYRVGGPDSRKVAVLFNDITDRKQAEDALRFLVECGTDPNKDFFQELARYLATCLGMDFVCIDTLQEGLLAAQTLAMYYDGKFEDNVSYALKDTPCGDVVGKGICCFPEGVRHRFPKDVVLQEMLAESYVGTTLWSSQGQPIGLIAVIARKPLANTKLATSILQLVAVRAAGELERRKAEDGLKAAKISAEHASKAKDHFLAVLSHELRNPLNPVLATASMLREDPRFDPDIREQLELICRNAELEARLIDDLLDVTRIERGKVELDRRPIELTTIIRHTVEVCLPDIEVRKLEFGVDAPDGPYLLHADAARIQQVFWNLLRNAIKFTPVGGCVGLRCRRDGGFVVVEIYDSGEGIEPAALSRLFNAFEQGDRSITRLFGGLGLGLTISKAMIELHDGSIHVHSEGKGKGSTFTVKLPLLTDETKQQPAVPARAQPQVTLRPLRILLVEDHGDTARIMGQLLSADGHDVQTAGDVSTALRLAVQQSFDLLLSDLGLPDGSGLDVMRSLRQRGLALPGIALSGYGRDQDIQQAREAGFAAHLTKPVSVHRLKEAIAKVSA